MQSRTFSRQKQQEQRRLAALERAGEIKPEIGDIVKMPYRPLGSRVAVGQIEDGENIGVFDTEDEADDAIRRWMYENQFFPTVWQMSDHGNMHLAIDFCTSDTFEHNGKLITLISKKQTEQSFIEIWLCHWYKTGRSEYVTWIYNTETEGFSGGHYYTDFNPALADFESRS